MTEHHRGGTSLSPHGDDGQKARNLARVCMIRAGAMPRFLRLVSILMLMLWVLAAPARAGTLGLVVSGDPAKQPVIETTLEPWLQNAGYDVRLSILDKAEIDKIVDCFILTDQRCAEPTVAGAGVAGLLFVMVEVKRDTRTSKDEVKLTGWLFSADGKALVAQSVYCRDCRNDTLGPTAEDLARALFSQADAGTGRISVASVPAGALVSVDGAAVGATPLEYGLRAGRHVVEVTLAGHHPQRKDVDVGKDKTVSLELTMRTSDQPIGGGGRGVLPYAVLGGGVAMLAAGATFYLIDQDCEANGPCDVPNTQETFRNSAPLGVGLAAAGAVATGVGVYLMMRAPRGSSGSASSAPAAVPVGWVTPGGGGVGMSTRF
jgi:hypothetical protein